MNQAIPLLTRRALLGGALAVPLLPGLAFGQSEETLMQIRIAFDGQTFTATLFDHASARELAAMLPLELTLSDFGGNEKIAYLPRKLTELVCYYVPWGNLAFFHGSYESTRDLVRLGRLDGGVEPLLRRGDFPVRIETL